jgi:hypothetical protein
MSNPTMRLDKKKIHMSPDNTWEYTNNPLGQSAKLNNGKVH